MFRHVNLIALVGTLFAGHAFAVPLLHTTDFITDRARSAFNGFEFAPTNSSGQMFAGAYPYVEDGIEVSQVDGDPPSQIWLTCGALRFPGYCFGTTGHDNNFSWYPNGGDSGYTRIARADGNQFESIGLLTGYGSVTTTSAYLNYTVLNGGQIVRSGRLFIPQNGPAAGYIGFSGGGFDELWLSAVPILGGSNGLAIDSIELSTLTPVPEPSSSALLVVGLLGFARRIRSAGGHRLKNRGAA